MRRILALAAPYRRSFVWTGVLVVATSALIWVRPALIRRAVDEELAAGDMQGMLEIFAAVVVVLPALSVAVTDTLRPVASMEPEVMV